MDTTPSKRTLIEGLQSYVEDVEGVPTVRGMRKDGPYSPHYYKQKFGTWHQALRAANIQPSHGVTPDVSEAELLEELNEVANIVDRPPRRRDVEEHGEYPSVVYHEAFDSFVVALERAGIDPDEKQYRFSSIETPKEKRGSANIEKLRNDGPTAASELPQGRSKVDRQRGVWKFGMSSGATKGADSIYYLHGEHAPELVIRRFFEQNPHVLKYRDPHGIKIEINNHQSSWKELGRDIVNELVDEGAIPEHRFENLVLVRVYADVSSGYCFESTISNTQNMGDVSIGGENEDGERPIWGFTREQRDIWENLSDGDGLLFSTEPGQFTHYVSVEQTMEDNDTMTTLWVEYEDGVRVGGISTPRPLIVLGDDVQKVSISVAELEGDLDTDFTDDHVQRLGEDTLEPLLNTYGGFEPYLRHRDSDIDEIDLGSDPSTGDIVEVLRQVPLDRLPLHDELEEFEQIEREKRAAAFRDGIYELYSGCAICGARFESPRGGHDIEAAHIVPKAQDGPDLLQNGLGLCARHHWAFDEGWFEISEDYEIQVRDRAGLAGYETFRQYDGATLQLPDKEHLRPHTKYIRERFE